MPLATATNFDTSMCLIVTCVAVVSKSTRVTASSEPHRTHAWYSGPKVTLQFMQPQRLIRSRFRSSLRPQNFRPHPQQNRVTARYEQKNQQIFVTPIFTHR